MMHVPYRGTPPLTTDVLGGQVHVAFDFMPTYVPLINEGKLRALAVTSSARAPELPDVMTVQEAGFAGFEATAWYAIAAPAGTPADIVQKVNALTNAYLKSDKGKAQIEPVHHGGRGRNARRHAGLHQERTREVGSYH